MTFRKIFSRASKAATGFRQDASCFSLGIAFWKLLAKIAEHSGLPGDNPLCIAIFNKKHKRVLGLLRSEFKQLIGRYTGLPESAETNPGSRIWVCWLQGEETAPEIVKKCIGSIRAHSGERDVCIVTQDNFGDYLSLPKHVLEKYKHGVITRTHFSDILRVSLLAEYGGLWLDSTVFCSREIPKWYFSAPVFYCRISDNPAFSRYVGRENWTFFIIGGRRNSLLFRYMRDMYFAYTERFDNFVDYFLADYLIALGRSEIPAIEETLAALPFNNTDCHELAKKMSKPFDREQFNEMIAGETLFFKLSYHIQHRPATDDGHKTFFGALLSGELSS